MYIIGHSQGGFIAPEIALGHDEVRGVVLIASAARPITDVLKTQVYAVLKAHNTPEEEIKKNQRSQAQYLRSLGDKNRDFMKSWKEVNPADSLKALQADVLAILGEDDIQIVPSAEAPVLRDVLSQNANASVVVLPGLDHLMMQTQGIPGMGWYSHPTRKPDPSFLNSINEWMQNNPCEKPNL